MTPRQRSHAKYLMDVMHRLEWDFHHTIFRGHRIPPEWDEIARATPRSTKVKCTLEIKADVLKFFKSMGKGHGPRMNDVLRADMHARLASVIEGAETIAQYKGGMVGENSPKPAFGDVGRIEVPLDLSTLCPLTLRQGGQHRDEQLQRRVQA